MCYFNLHRTVKLPPEGEEYMCFRIDGKSAQDFKCVKSRITTKVIDCVLFVNTFEKKYVVLKGM